MLIDVADLDCIYLSYDEPRKEEFWIKIQNMVPWAKRVDGVKGSDAAHKAAAAASDTERFILIDGDNIPDAEFFDLQLDIKEEYNDCVYRWKARNHINGLMYGNGGLSCWTKTFINNMRTHEVSDGSSDTAVEFCFDNKYIAMHNVYSTTYPNGSEYHAWRAGFREGVKLCLAKGEKPTPDNFDEIVNKQNIQNLSIWMSVGADVKHVVHRPGRIMSFLWAGRIMCFLFSLERFVGPLLSERGGAAHCTRTGRSIIQVVGQTE